MKTIVVTAEVVPLRATWRTFTELRPCNAEKEVRHVVPPSVEYWTVAPDSTPVTVSVPTRVTPSVEPAPVSFARATIGASRTFVTEIVNARSIDAPPESVDRMRTV